MTNPAQTDLEIARLIYDPHYDTWHGGDPIGAWYLTGAVDGKEPDFDPDDTLSQCDRPEDAHPVVVVLATEYLATKGWEATRWSRDMTVTTGTLWVGYGHQAGEVGAHWRADWRWNTSSHFEGFDNETSEPTARAKYAQAVEIGAAEAVLYRRDVCTLPDGRQHVGPWLTVERLLADNKERA